MESDPLVRRSLTPVDVDALLGNISSSPLILNHSASAASPNLRKKAIVTVRRSRDRSERRVAFFPESSHTTSQSLHALIASAFGMPADAKFVLEDEEDGTLVPLDKSLCYLKSVRLVEVDDDGFAKDAGSAARAKEETIRLAKLLDFSAMIATESDPERAIRTVVRQSKELLQAKHVVLYVVNLASKQLVPASSSDDLEYHVEEENCTDEEDFPALDEGGDLIRTPSRSAAGETKVPIARKVSLEVSTVPAVEAVKTGQLVFAPRLICAPVREAGGAIVGALEVVRSSSSPLLDDDDDDVNFAGRDFTESDSQTIEYIATCTGSVLHRLQQWFQSSRAEDRAQSLLKVTKMLAAAKQPEEVIKLVVNEAYSLLHAERVAVFLVHAQEKELEICLSKDASGTRIPMTAGLAGYVARTGESVNVLDVRKDDRFHASTDLQTGFRTRAVLCCPIFDSGGKVIGVIQALNKKSSGGLSTLKASSSATDDVRDKVRDNEASDFESFTEDDRELLEMLTQSAGVTLQNAQLLQTAEHARITARALLRLIQKIVGESDFLKLDRLLRSCAKQLLDCDQCILAWFNRADSSLRIFMEEGQTLSISLDDKRSVEAQIAKLPIVYNCTATPGNDLNDRKSRYAERMGYKVQSVLSSPIGGSLQGPIAVMIAFNKLEPESSLNSVANSSSAAPGNGGISPGMAKRTLSRAYKSFSKEDEADLSFLCIEVEGALRAKKNLRMDFARLVFGQAQEEEDHDDETEGGDDDPSGPTRLQRQSSSSSSSEPIAPAKVDAQQRRLMLLYSSIDDQTSTSSLPSSSSANNNNNNAVGAVTASTMKIEKRASAELGGGASKQSFGSKGDEGSGGRKRKQDEREEDDLEEEAEEATRPMSPDTIATTEANAQELVKSTLSNCLELDVLGQNLETIKSWTLALFYSDMATLTAAGVDLNKLPMFVSEAHDHYNANPFHNFYHAFAVLHTSYDIVRNTVEGRRLDHLCALSILLASLCHDLGHKGMTNSYESATMSELALQYSDEAVLERFHAYMAFKLLYQQEKSNILATMAPGDMSIVRKYIIEGILATDMRRHAEHVAELELVVVERRRSLLVRNGSFLDTDFIRTPTATRQRRISVDTGSPSSSTQTSAPSSPKGGLPPHHRRRSSSFTSVSALDTEAVAPVKRHMPSPKNAFDAFFEKPEGKSLLVRSIVHASDLSGQTLKIEFAEDWGRRITAEFSAQAEVERSMGLTVSVPVCNSEADFCKSQVFFIRQIVLPLWRGLAELLPELHVRVDALEHNVEHYEKAVKKLSGTAPQGHHDGQKGDATPARAVSPLGLDETPPPGGLEDGHLGQPPLHRRTSSV